MIETQFLIGKGLMSAPLLEEGKTKRTVYFPTGDSWFNFHTGEEHTSGSLALIENQLTDLVPLFLRNGYMTFRQNTDNITKTSQLDNRFQILAACKKHS